MSDAKIRTGQTRLSNQINVTYVPAKAKSMGTLTDYYRDLENLREKNLGRAFSGAQPPNILLGGRKLVVLRHDTGEPSEVSTLRGQVLYRFYSMKRELLYVGMTRDLFIRCRGAKNWRPGAGHQNREWWPSVHVVTVNCHYRTRAELELAEAAAIRDESPIHNVLDQFLSRGIAVSARGGVNVHGETM